LRRHRHGRLSGGEGLPFREAHEIVGRIVRHCLDLQQSLDDLSLEELQTFSLLFDRDVMRLSHWIHRSIAARCSVARPVPWSLNVSSHPRRQDGKAMGRMLLALLIILPLVLGTLGCGKRAPVLHQIGQAVAGFP
jgi:hypothetical protein